LNWFLKMNTFWKCFEMMYEISIVWRFKMVANPRWRHLVHFRFWPIVFVFLNRFRWMNTFWKCFGMMYKILLSWYFKMAANPKWRHLVYFFFNFSTNLDSWIYFEETLRWCMNFFNWCFKMAPSSTFSFFAYSFCIFKPI
jgi:hypothetical protein